ncbi:MAG: oligosaccharide flippase family protein [Nitrospiraceae bacterium]|nr:oligosaccharide flippase family protein [Nitrospira sp.]MCB9775717.1 oligosaccharide flippase family protein [Nitrospiraceae bacterium]
MGIRVGGKVSRIRNVLANWGGYIFAVGVNFVLSPFIVHSLGDESYGIWVLLGSIVGYLGLLDLGVRGAVTRYIAKFHAQESHLEATRVASSALVVFVLVGFVAIAVAGVLAIVIDRVFQIPPELVAVARVVLILGGVNMAISMISGVYGGVVAGLQRFDIANLFEIAIGVVRVILVVLALKTGYGLIALALIQLGVSGLRGFASFVLSRRLYPQLRVCFKECHRSHVTMIFSFSVSVLLLQASGTIILFTDSIVIGSFLPLSMVTLFAIASNLTEYARAPVSGISQTLTPSASALEAENEGDELERILLVSARIATLIVLPIVVTFIFRGEAFIGLWMGEEYAKPSGEILWILSLALWFAIGYQVVVATMMGISKHAGLVPAFIIEAVCNIGLSLYWLQSYGIVGVAWGTTAPRLVASIIFAPWYVNRVLGTSIPKFWLTVWIRPAVAITPFALATWQIEQIWPADNLILYFAQVAAVLPLAAFGAWAVSLTSSERNRLAPPGFLRQLISKSSD